MNTRLVVQDPDGTTWQVRVRWLPRWRALSRRIGGWRRRPELADADPAGLADALSDVGPRGGGGGAGGWWPDDLGDDLIAGLLLLVALVVGGLVFWWLLLPLLLAVLDVAVVGVLVVAGVLARVLLRRPWTVQAVPVDAGRSRGSGRSWHRAVREPVSVQVVGWRRARRVRDELARSVTSGAAPAARGRRR